MFARYLLKSLSSIASALCEGNSSPVTARFTFSFKANALSKTYSKFLFHLCIMTMMRVLSMVGDSRTRLLAPSKE